MMTVTMETSHWSTSESGALQLRYVAQDVPSVVEDTAALLTYISRYVTVNHRSSQLSFMSDNGRL